MMGDGQEPVSSERVTYAVTGRSGWRHTYATGPVVVVFDDEPERTADR